MWLFFFYEKLFLFQQRVDDEMLNFHIGNGRRQYLKMTHQKIGCLKMERRNFPFLKFWAMAMVGFLFRTLYMDKSHVVERPLNIKGWCLLATLLLLLAHLFDNKTGHWNVLERGREGGNVTFHFVPQSTRPWPKMKIHSKIELPSSLEKEAI